MQLSTVQTVLAVAGSAAGLVATIAALPLSLARYRSWRLRKLMETINALDNERHASQREVLMPRADKLANKTAAYQIPTPWSRFVLTVVVVAWFVALAVSGIGGFREWSKPWGIFTLAVVPGALVVPCLIAGLLWRSYRHTRRERARFIRKVVQRTTLICDYGESSSFSPGT